MAEQEEYKLPEISEEQIEKAAMPIGKRVNEDVSEETQFIELDDNKDELKPLQEDDITEDFVRALAIIGILIPSHCSQSRVHSCGGNQRRPSSRAWR